MADINRIIDELLLELSVQYPFPNMGDRDQIVALLEICDDLGYGEEYKLVLFEMLLEADGNSTNKESGLFPGKFHLGGGYYSSKEGGEAEFKNDKGNLRPVTPEEKAKFDSKGMPTANKQKEPSAETPSDTTDIQSNPESPKDNLGNAPKAGIGKTAKTLVKNPQVVKKAIEDKVKGWSVKEKEFFNRGEDKAGSPTRRSWKDAIMDKAKGARNAIVHGFKHEYHTFKTAADGLHAMVHPDREMTPEHKKAMFSVGVKIAMVGVTAGAGGALAHGVGSFASHVAMEFIPHVVAETVAIGVVKASLFASVDGDDERILNDFAASIADKMENMEITDEMMLQMVESYNEKRNTQTTEQPKVENEIIDLNELFSRILTEEEGTGESKQFPGKFHLGGGYYSSKKEGDAEFKNEKGNLRPLTPEEKAEYEKKKTEPTSTEPSTEKPTSEPADNSQTPQDSNSKEKELIDKTQKEFDTKEQEFEKTLSKDNPDRVLNDPKASAKSKAMARAFQAQQNIDKNKREDSGQGTIGEPARLQPANEDTDSKVKTFRGKKSGKEIQTLEFEDGGLMFGTVHRDTKMVDDIIDQIKATIPQEKWGDIVFLGEGGATGDNDEIVFHDEMEYAAPKFKKMGADIDTWDGDELDVHDDQSKLYKKQMEKTGLNHSQVKAGNWASMIGQGEGTDTMSPNDYLDEEGKQFIQDAAKEAGLPPIENWDSPTGEVPNEKNPEGSGDRGTLFRLAFPEDNGDKETKINDIQVAFNNTRDENIIEKRKELASKGKIPVVIAGESHVELVDKMMQGGSKDKTETQSVKPEKIANEMPKADTETFAKDGKALDGIEPQQLQQFNTDINKVAKMIDDAKAKGEKAPNINLCDITIPGTNLYCDDNQGIPREEMPQFKGKAVAGSRAANMETDKSGEVDTEPVFREMLKQKGIKVLQTEVPADKLKATQKDLVGEKVIGMMGALEEDPNHPKITAPIYVSRDGYVIDGHHRWAAVVAYNAKHPDNPIPMKTTVIDMDIKDAIPMANKFAEDMGIAAKKADVKDGEAPTEEPKVTDDKIGAKATTDAGKKLYHIGNGYYSDSPNGEAKYIRVESVVENAIQTDNKKWWKLLFEANIKATVDGGEEGVFKEIPKDEIEVATDAAKQSSNVEAIKGDWEQKALSQMSQSKYSDSILDDNLKQKISSIIGKMTSGQDLTDEEKQIAKDYIKIVKTDSKVKLYIASKNKGDWSQQGYVKVELGSGNAAKKWADEASGKYDVTSGASSQGAIGKKQASPAKTNKKRKKAKISVIDDNTISFNGKEMKKLPVLTFDEIKADMKTQFPDLDEKELNKRAAILEKRIKRYNDNIDAFKEVAEQGGEFEYVDYGDVDTPEGRSAAIQNMVDISKQFFVNKLGDKANLPENKIVLDTLDSLKKFENIDLENDEEARKEYEKLLSDLIVHMTNSKDFRDGVADFAEQKVAMELLGKGYPTYLPSDEAFKTADVLVVNPVEFNGSKTEISSDQSKSLQLLYVTLEFSGGISVKYQGGGAGNSDEKVKKTRFKNNETRRRLNGMLATYDTMYPDSRTPPNFPPSKEKLDELNSTHEDNKKWAIENGIATEDEIQKAEDWADKRIEAVFKTFESNGVGDCMSDDEKNRFKETMRAYYKNQKLMEVIYNNDADYTLFGNSNQKIKVSKGKAISNESDVADGVEDICYMKIKDDVGFNYSKQGDCTTVKPSNRNPSEIHSHKPTIK